MEGTKKTNTKSSVNRRPRRGEAFRDKKRAERASGIGGGEKKGRGGGFSGRGSSRVQGVGKREKGRTEFEQKVVSVRRVARVVAGGRRFSFSVVVIIGNRKGSVGLGTGKASDTSLAIEKAFRDAKKNLLKVMRTEKNSIPHEVRARYSSSDVFIIPAEGKGLSAGSSVRTVLDLAGVGNVTAKIFSRSRNKLNNARAALEALRKLKQPRQMVQKEKEKVQ